MSEMIEELIGPVPEGWEYKTLGRVCKEGGGDIQTGPFGSQLHASDYVPAGIPSIMPQNIGDNRIVEDGIARITPLDASRLSRYLVRKGDIVYSRRGDVERRALVREHEDGWLCGTGCLRVRLGDRGPDPRYASYYLGHPSVREWIVRHAHGATMPNLNTSILGACPFVVPPRAEQRAIAHILGTLDDKIELNRKQNETLEAMARALFKAWFVDFEPVRAKIEGRWQRGQSLPGLPAHLYDIFPDRLVESELGEIPEGWEVGAVADLAEVSSGKRPNVRFPEASEQAAVPLWGGNGPMAFVTEALVDEPILLTGRVGTLGSVFRITTPCWPSDNTLVLRANQQAAFEYLFLQLQQIDFDSLNRGSTQPLLTQTDLKAVPLLLPESAVLEHFGIFSRGLYKRVDEAVAESRTLAQLRDTLLPKLISGELRIQDAEAFLKERGL
jgi:type I restriction enzyme S subunit